MNADPKPGDEGRVVTFFLKDGVRMTLGMALWGTGADHGPALPTF